MFHVFQNCPLQSPFHKTTFLDFQPENCVLMYNLLYLIAEVC